MPRPSLVNVERTEAPKIIVAGSSTVSGRMSTLLRIRPTLVERVKMASAGPMYLIIEAALEDMLAAVENSKDFRVIDPAKMRPTTADFALLKEEPPEGTPGPERGRTSRKAPAKRATPAKKA